MAAFTAIVLALAAYLLAREVFDVDFLVRIGNSSGGLELVPLVAVIISTLVGAIGATVLFGVLARFVRRPLRAFQIIAVLLLVLSFMQPLTQPDEVTGATRAWLIVMHILAGAAIIGVFSLRYPASEPTAR